MKVCVFGGSGFLGSHVVDALLEKGYNVINFDIQKSRWIKDNQKEIIGDILDYKSVQEAVKGCSIVYNFAGLSDLNDGLHSPLKTAELNIIGNLNILEACRTHNVERFIYASSIYVFSKYGGFYRCSKQSSEHYVEEYANTFGLDFTILRYGSLYGPRSDEKNGLYKIIKTAIDNKEVSYSGSEEAMREYIYVCDAAKASVMCLDEEFRNKSLVLTGQEAIRVRDMLEMIKEILDFDRPVKFISGKQLGHYIKTPYSYSPKLGDKFIPSCHMDLGQGLLELIGLISNEKSQSEFRQSS